MKRRSFILGLAAAPLFIRRAFGDASVGGAPANARVARPTEPTLVFVVPRGESERWERGNLFGDFLNKADARELIALGRLDVVCARAADFGVAGEPLALFVDGSDVHRLDAPTKGALPKLRRFLRESIPLPWVLEPAKFSGELTVRARDRYLKHAPRGSRWGNTGTCGVHYEEGPQGEQPDCGMAFAPEASRRFLDFYVKAS